MSKEPKAKKGPSKPEDQSLTPPEGPAKPGEQAPVSPEGPAKPVEPVLPKPEEPPVTLEQVLTSFADRVVSQIHQIMEGMRILAARIEILEKAPKTEIAAALEAQARVFLPLIQQATTPMVPSLASIMEVAREIVKLARNVNIWHQEPEETKKDEKR